jgi:hypothetical protein
MNNAIDKYRFPMLRHNSRIPLDLRLPKTELNYGQNNYINQSPNHGTYGELLFDERWRKKRETILVRDGRKCVFCDRNVDLQVHHRQYHFVKSAQKFKVPWDYDNSLLITLCKSCHNRGHNKFKVPTLSI